MPPRTPATPPERTHAWHALPSRDVHDRLEVPETGLSTDEAHVRLLQHGRNEIPRTERREALRIAIRQVNDPLIFVLLASTVLAMLTGKFFDGLVICGVVVLNAIIGFAQEFRAGKAIKALSRMVPHRATVKRDGKRLLIPSAELVPGDVVLLQSGDKVPADLRLTTVRSLRIEEAALTGESVPVEKSPEPTDEAAGIGDRYCMAFSGTLVTWGTGTGVVVATGGQTELGRISQMLGEATELETPLTRQLGVVGKWIAVAIVVTSILLLGIGLIRGYPLADAVLAAVTLAVAAIPEGLPAIVTIALAIGVQRMARRRAIIRKLPAVETLGSTTVICTDKTGTLTRNEMTVRTLWTPSDSYRLGGIGYVPEGPLRDATGAQVDSVPPHVEELLRSGSLCNDAEVVHRDGTWHVIGDPTEGALVVAAHKVGLEPAALRGDYRRIDAIPFESERQFMATLHEDPDGKQVIYLKGAPEAVMARCFSTNSNGNPSGGHLAEVVAGIASQGMRVLGFAVRRPTKHLTSLTEHDVASGFKFLGLQGMIDPPRTEAVEAVAACHEAGITVKMITGDHAETARAIGLELGLAKDDETAVTGAELSRMTDEELHHSAATHNVFARVAPEHKLRLVRALQSDGHVVAMTGDGVNDAPALKQADIGVAMGITGTAVSKEAADMVLTDDNFASIEAAVEEGRRVYDNLVKALAFVLPTNLGLAVIMTIAVAFFPVIDGEPLLPMQPVQILWINLVAAVALALPLAFEAMEPDLMRRPPRVPNRPVLSPFVLRRTFLVALYMALGAVGLFLLDYWTEMQAGTTGARALASAQTEAVTTVILFQSFYLLNCRSLHDSLLTVGFWTNRWIWVGIGIVLLLQLGFIYLPFMNAIFGSAPIGLLSWVEAGVVAFLIMPLIALEKVWMKRVGGMG